MTTFGLVLIVLAKVIAGFAVGVIVQACIDERRRRRYEAWLRELIERDEAGVIAELLEKAMRK